MNSKTGFSTRNGKNQNNNTISEEDMNATEMFDDEGIDLDDDNIDLSTIGGTKPQDIAVKETVNIAPDGKVLNKTVERNYVEKTQEPKVYKLGKGDMTVSDLANNLFPGEENNAIHHESLAKIFNPKAVAEAGYGNYKVNLGDHDQAQALGNYLAGKNYSKDYIESLDGGIYGNVTEGIDYQLRDIEKKTGINNALKDVDKKYRTKLQDTFYGKDTQINKILDKLDDGETISDVEAKEFKKARDIFEKAHNEFVKTSEKFGFKGENIYADEYNGFRGKVKDNETYKKLLNNKRILDYNYAEGVTAKSIKGSDVTGEKGSYDAGFVGSKKVDTDYLGQAKKYRDYDKATKEFVEKGADGKTISKDAMKYLADTDDAFYGSKEAEKLFELQKNGVDIGDDGREILSGFAKSKNINLKPSGKVVSNLSKAAQQKAEGFNIKTENLAYTGDSGLKLVNDNGKFSIAQSSIDIMKEEEKTKFSKLINSKDVGMENLTELGGILNRRFDENQVVASISKASGKDLANGFADIESKASSNFEKLQTLYAPEEYAKYGLSKEAILKRSGVDEKYVKEIAGATSTKDLSPKAVGALYNANNSVTESEALLGNISADAMKKIKANNSWLADKMQGMTLEQERAVLGEQLGLTKTGISGGMNIQKRGFEYLKDEKNARNFIEGLTGGDEAKRKAMLDVVDFKGEASGYKDLYDDGGSVATLLEDAKKGNIAESLKKRRIQKMYEKVNESIDYVVAKHGDSFRKDYKDFDAKVGTQKDIIEKQIKQAKNFGTDELKKFESVIEDGVKATKGRATDLSGPLVRNSGKLSGLKGAIGGKTIGIGLGIGALVGIGVMASNASQERERKRQEMNQLLAAQASNIRGGY